MYFACTFYINMLFYCMLVLGIFENARPTSSDRREGRPKSELRECRWIIAFAEQMEHALPNPYAGNRISYATSFLPAVGAKWSNRLRRLLGASWGLSGGYWTHFGSEKGCEREDKPKYR